MNYRITILISIAAFALSSCNNNFSKVEEGLSTQQLSALVGEPDSIRDDFFNQVWFYKTHLITVENDTVRKVTSIAEIKAETQRMQEEYNKIMGFE